MKQAFGKTIRSPWLTAIALGSALAMTAAGCSSSSGSGATENPGGASSPSATSDAGKALEPVELTWYYPQNKANPDLALVNEAVNKITKEKINATIKLRPVDFGTYEQKMNTVVAASEPFDIIWNSNWLFKFEANQKKGVFQPLDDLLKTKGQKLFASLEQKFWDDAKLEGKIYAVPNFQFSASRAGLVIQKRFVDKYKLDISTIKKIEDIEPFLKQIKDNEPGITPFGTTKGFYTGMLYNIDVKVPVYENDPNNKVLPDVTKEMRENYKLAHSWYTKGYINQDAATLKAPADAYNKGTTAVWFDWTGKPGSEVEFKAAAGGFDVVLVPLSKANFTGAASTLNAISRTSKNPERAMMFLELVNTDKELYNTLVYGIEGKHYTKTTGNYIKINQDAGYFTNTDWVFGNISNEYLPEGVPADKLAQTIKLNNEAYVSKYNGFVFNSDPVKTEVANVKAVKDEYGAGLGSGTLDPEKYLPIFEDKLQKAGADKIVAEMQKQLDEWLKANGKK
ncbi:ABC transporter substrate-binding protein [Paenibacillus flagellatus]|uniref:ABC transporter substrate-binding protein n=1 Tax=Paenibacillus flagellatus TaxID=2211139 RepID=A0A2V5KM24_9BACL|nr:ABC transporter substrate-binding protein [Paenibacillus flagellatus]PYI51937.1 ABC transporter substrate-binding protein [Paenibacillus flagellatus]